ncbi:MULTISPECIES: diaminopimelate epimerase [unclassified Cocleimonas]|uniref:diaminopimelate epimerase n=1 Tax=unclassified Cocleimonas TaxID=2639732 RepID=UPI002DB8E6DD|nr:MULTISPECIES: diaminopimelate epimerase [unclassified Cocleimonas]
MNIIFTKMHGLGNDFVVINGIDQTINLTPEQIRFMSDRQFGIGFDQLLLVEKSDVEDTDFRYRIFNSDGGEVEQCGNGARCFAHFVRNENLTDKKEIAVITKNGRLILNVEDNGNVTVDMGAPILEPAQIPFIANAGNEDKAENVQQKSYSIQINQQNIEIGAVSMGNPHAVVIVDDTQSADVEKLGKAIQESSCFPNSVNVGFMQVIDRQNIKLRVYERGVGETQACGTGACAAVVAGIVQGLLDSKVDVNLLGGNLSISWAGDTNPVMMSGPTATVFKGMISL